VDLDLDFPDRVSDHAERIEPVIDRHPEYIRAWLLGSRTRTRLAAQGRRTITASSSGEACVVLGVCTVQR
jgi:hypothetical protein